jgi:hypothetical protein
VRCRRPEVYGNRIAVTASHASTDALIDPKTPTNAELLERITKAQEMLSAIGGGADV